MRGDSVLWPGESVAFVSIVPEVVVSHRETPSSPGLKVGVPLVLVPLFVDVMEKVVKPHTRPSLQFREQ